VQDEQVVCMKRLTGFACLLTAAAAGLAGWLALGGAHELPMAPIQTDKADIRLVAQGAYLAKAGDCAACHTASPGQSFAGGVALATPFGTITSTNITPDPQTGIGLWSEAAFSRALRQGIARDGHQLYPAMPYTAYTRLSDADIHALKAYFDSLAPIRHANQPSQLRFPFNIRPLLRLWNILFFTDKRFQAAPDRSPEWNRGAYLVEGAGHCGSCHTGKNPLGGDKAPLQGGALLGWYAPELSRNPHVGLGQWSITGTMDYLKTGRSPLPWPMVPWPRWSKNPPACSAKPTCGQSRCISPAAPVRIALSLLLWPARIWRG
jgi:mono/diheme cytochrome c family protein